MYKNVRSSWAKHLDFIIWDILGIQVAYCISYMIKNGSSLPYEVPMYFRLGIFLVMIDICIVFFSESYKGILRRGHYEELKAVVSHMTLIIASTLAYSFFATPDTEYSRTVFIGTWVLSIGFLYGIRESLKYYIKTHVKSTYRVRSVVLITSDVLANDVVENIRKNQCSDFMISGIVILDKNRIGRDIDGIPVVASKDSLLTYLKMNIVDEVFINLPNDLELFNDMVDDCINMGITVHLNLLPTMDTDTEMDKVIENFAGYSVLSKSIKMATPKQLFLKRTLDIIGGIAGIILTAIVFLIIAPIIYIQSPGPIFFSQERIGKNGRRFRIYKFRSMYLDAEERKVELMAQNEMNGLMFKMTNDPRVFPFGSWMRKTSIDELPQFFNVLRGDMSLVGTRPPTVDEYIQYDLEHKRRLAIKPGITGIWQVSGRSDVKDFDQVVELDTKYITEWSLGLDLKILCKTVGVVLKREGSV